MAGCAAPPTPPPAPAPIPEQTPAPTPTPEAEMPLSEDFEGGTQNWSLEEGWHLEKIDSNTVLKGEGHKWARLENRSWDDYALKAKFKLIQGTIHFNYRCNELDGYRYFIGAMRDALYLNKQSADQFYELTAVSLKLDDGWHEIEIRGYGDTINIYIDDTLLIVYEDDNPILSGGIAFETLEDSAFLVDDVEVRETLPSDIATKLMPVRIHNASKSGTLTRDEIWSGEIHITDHIFVPKGVSLTIEPGTVVKFKHYRGYKEPWKRPGLIVEGTIKAVGTPEKQIWFTSDAEEPINGDWEGIGLENTKNSEFKYVIVEFGEVGIEQFDSEVTISNSIIRWNNAEGLYAERSKPIFSYNTLYGNGYHEIALEQYNENVQILYNIIRDGRDGVHFEKSSVYLEGNYFKNYERHAITAGMESGIVVKRNKFENIGYDPPISVYGGSTAEIENNDYGAGFIPIPEFDYEDVRPYELGYVPGDPEDRFLYIYDEVDETRRTIKKIGQGLSFGWALVYAENNLWRFSDEISGEVDFIRIDPITGRYQSYGNNEIMKPTGLTYDGEYFWVNDFSLLKIFKFKLNGNFIEILDSFDIPEKDKGGTSGLTTDGDFLYLRSRNGSKLYKLDKNGNVVDEIHFENGGVGGALVWTGNYFWTSGGCAKGLGKWTKDGKLVGEIYPPAKDTWALAWDGNYLWSIQRTCEVWNEPKIYQIEILDDSLK